VNEQGAPKLMDFGIARNLENALNKNSSMDDYRASYLQALSPDYASPEQLEGRYLSTASDIYSAGKILEKLILPKLNEGDFKSILYRNTIKECVQIKPQERIDSFDKLGKGLQQISQYLIPYWISSNVYQRFHAFILRNKKVCYLTVLFLLILSIFIFKLIQQNTFLREQNTSNQQVISFLSKLFGNNELSNDKSTIFNLLSNDENNSKEIDENNLIKKKSDAFSLFVFKNHSVKIDELIELSIVPKARFNNYRYTVIGEGAISKHGLYRNKFLTTGVHSVKINAISATGTDSLTLYFIVRNDLEMPFTFVDIPPDDPNYGELHYLALKGILIGRPGEQKSTRIFSPNQLIKQAEALKLIMMAAHYRGIINLKKSLNNYPNLLMVNSRGGIEDFSWASTFLDTAVELNIIKEGKSFIPKIPTTKQWMSHLLVKTLNLFNPVDISKKYEKLFNDFRGFDNNHYYKSAQIASFYNLVESFDNNFQPNKNLTRRDVAVIASKILQLPIVHNGILKKDVMAKQAEEKLNGLIPNLQTPSYKRINNNIIALDETDPSLTNIELIKTDDEQFVVILTNTENNVKNSFTVPLSIL